MPPVSERRALGDASAAVCSRHWRACQCRRGRKRQWQISRLQADGDEHALSALKSALYPVVRPERPDSQDVVGREVGARPLHADHQLDRGLVRSAIAELSPIFREVIVLREIEGLAYREISRVTGAPIGTVMSRLARGRRELRKALGRMMDQDKPHAV